MIQITPLVILLAVVNVVALTFFGFDKLKSKSRGWRIPESRLLLVALIGPFGAYAGMLLFKHKTRKPKFFLVPLFMLMQIGLIVYLHLI